MHGEERRPILLLDVKIRLSLLAVTQPGCTMSLLLGPEILDNIFSLLQRDHVTLKSCSQASSGFSLLVEPHLYAQVIIYNRNINGLVTFTAFSKLLLNNPRIASHVRSLTIMFRQKYRSQSPLNDDVISTILPKLIKLKMITLNSSGVRYTSVSWSRLCETFRVAFEDCLQLPSMREVAFEDILGFPLSILEQCRTMKRLLLRGIYFPTNSDSESRSRLGCPELDSLLISYCNHLSEITTWVNISDLRSLYFQPRAIDDFRELSQLLERCADSLNQLEIDLLRMCTSEYFTVTGYLG